MTTNQSNESFEPPSIDEPILELGFRSGWVGDQPFGLGAADRAQHVLLLGKSGTGKSTAMYNAILQAIHAGEGLLLVDPHGDLSAAVLEAIPRWRTDHVLVVDPSDAEHAVGIDLLYSRRPRERSRMVGGVVEAFRALFGESWGPRLSYILTNALAALSEAQNVSLLSVPRMLVEKRYRDWVLKQVSDPVVRSFWTNEFEAWGPRLRAEAISPVLNKVNALLTNPTARAMFGQTTSRWDARWLMDHRRIVIANLAKGLIGADAANLIGSILVTQFGQAAMGRADVREEERVPFSMFIDEWQNCSSEFVGSLLSEIRKHKVQLVLAGQFLAQVPETLQQAVLGNIGTIIAFRLGESDARVLAREFANDFLPEHFTDLANFEVLVKPLSARSPLAPFRGRTLPPLRLSTGNAANILRRSRERYAVKRAVIEAKIARWFERGR